MYLTLQNITKLQHTYFIFRFNLTSEGNEENLDSTSYNKVHQHSPGMSSKHESLLSSVLVPKINKINTEVTDDDIPPPLPTTSPPKLTPESTLTWKHKERIPLKLGNYKSSYYVLMLKNALCK